MEKSIQTVENSIQALETLNFQAVALDFPPKKEAGSNMLSFNTNL